MFRIPNHSEREHGCVKDRDGAKEEMLGDKYTFSTNSLILETF